MNTKRIEWDTREHVHFFQELRRLVLQENACREKYIGGNVDPGYLLSDGYVGMGMLDFMKKAQLVLPEESRRKISRNTAYTMFIGRSVASPYATVFGFVAHNDNPRGAWSVDVLPDGYLDKYPKGTKLREFYDSIKGYITESRVSKKPKAFFYANRAFNSVLAVNSGRDTLYCTVNFKW